MSQGAEDETTVNGSYSVTVPASIREQAAYMRREEVEFIYAFDGDFDAVDGIVGLSTAENPFT